MQRLERFKWIPMLLRAWDEARERTEAERKRMTGKEDSEDAAQSPAQTNKPSHPVGKAAGALAKRVPPATRRVKRSVGRPPRPTAARRQGVQTHIRKSDYQAVLQELREAKKQLGQLDSIRHQLDELQAWFETRMTEAEKSSSAKPLTRPMQPYGLPVPGQMPGPNPHGMHSQGSPLGAQLGAQAASQQAPIDRIDQEPQRHTEAQKEGSD